MRLRAGQKSVAAVLEVILEEVAVCEVPVAVEAGSGPEGGKEGGIITCQGTPEALVKKYLNDSHTMKYLIHELK
jgi:excinuclease UvrABC ATPase subunit